MFRAAIRLARPAALLAIAAVAVACVGSAGAAGSTPSPKPVDPDKVIFRVSWEGGFVTPETLLARLPVVVVYADGRVITQGPVPMIYPGTVHAEPPGADAVAGSPRPPDRPRPREGPAQGRQVRLPGHRRCRRHRPRDQSRREELPPHRLRAGRGRDGGRDRASRRGPAGGQGRTDRDARVHRRPDGRPRDRLRRPAARLRVRSAPAVREAGRDRREQRVPGRAAADRLAARRPRDRGHGDRQPVGRPLPRRRWRRPRDRPAAAAGREPAVRLRVRGQRSTRSFPSRSTPASPAAEPSGPARSSGCSVLVDGFDRPAANDAPTPPRR